MQKNILDELVLRKLIEKRLRGRALPRERCQRARRIPERPASSRARTASTTPIRARSVLAQINKSAKASSSPRRASQLLVNQLQQGIGGSYFLTRAEAQRLFNLENEEREVQYAAVRGREVRRRGANRRSRRQGLLRQERRSLHDHRIGGARIRRAAPRAACLAGRAHRGRAAASCTTTIAATTCSMSVVARATS